MTTGDARQIVAYLTAAFPDQALEPESAMIWISELRDLVSFDAALAAAKLIGRQGDRFPKLKEFRQAYRQQLDRQRPPALEEGPRPPIPDDVAVWLRERGLTPAALLKGELILKTDLPETRSMAARPVWDRYERRAMMREVTPPTPIEIHDAIIILRDHNPADDTYVGQALFVEAQRIMDEASAA